MGRETRRQLGAGYAASSTIALRVTDASVLGRLVPQAIAGAHAAAGDLRWRVALDNPARD